MIIMYTLDLIFILENMLHGYTGDSTLIAVVPSPLDTVAVAESVNHEFYTDREWCDLWGMRLNMSKTKTIIASRSCAMHPQSLTINYG